MKKEEKSGAAAESLGGEGEVVMEFNNKNDNNGHT